MTTNPLYPIFLKTKELQIVVVGGGYVALEKLTFLFKSSPSSKVTLISPMIRKETRSFIKGKPVVYIEDGYKVSYLTGAHMAIATTDKPEVNKQVFHDCRSQSVLVNVADNPPLCDFYMGSIVTKGNLKIAISTNGKSPTFAKRFRQWLENFLPEKTDDILNKLYIYRSQLKGDFEHKVNAMNKATENLIKNYD
jgi:precorrin-2 dehydrogenase/sirohydrochlorin ferrochelatase